LGQVARLRGQRVYLDTNIIIYIFERVPEYESTLAELLKLIANQSCKCITAEIAATEVIPGIARKGNADEVARCIRFFDEGDVVELQATSRRAFYQAGLLRSQMRISSADAIHLATAIESRCDVFLTNDRALGSFRELPVLRLSELVSDQ
jgi:predicted nucleic acid-binding protein